MLFEDLETALIQADVSLRTARKLLEDLARSPQAELEDIESNLKSKIIQILSQNYAPLKVSPQPPTVILTVGVNGTGKTTTIAKLAHRFIKEGKRVLLVASDTFRAAAIDQLEIWAKRLGAEMIKHKEGADPAAVVYDAIDAAKARKMDFVIIDTAGRMHTKRNLMEELKKIERVINKGMGRPPDESLLVLDATTGQNALVQAKEFQQAINITGIALAKLDGTAKGGIVITIKDELEIPIKLIGTGENLEDLQDFEPQKFAQALFE